LSRFLFISTLTFLCAAAGSALVQGQTPPSSNEKQLNVIKNGTQELVPLVLEDFTVGPGATQKDVQSVYSVLSEDLDFSNYFVITRVPQLVAGDPVAVTGKAVVRGSVEMARGQLVLKGSLEGLPGRSRIFSRDYATKPEWYRETAHRFADDIVHYMTGDNGIARTKIAFVSNKTGNKEIYVVDYDGNGLRQVTHNRSINMSPAWSPDCRQIVYTSFKKGDPDIYTIDLASGTERLVAGGPGVQGAPSFSPDGKSILFSNTRGRESELFIVPAAGGQARRVTREGGINTSPSWSPDGHRVVFTSDRSGNPQLYVTDVDGGIPRRLTSGGSWNDLASWSPTGDLVAYSARQSDGFRVAVVDPSGLDGERLITTGPGSEEHPSWAPNGRHLAFSSGSGGHSSIYVLHVDSGQRRQLVSGNGIYQGAAWSGVPAR